MPTFQEVIDARSIVALDILEVYRSMVTDEIYSEVTIHSPIKTFVTDVHSNKFNFPESLTTIDIGEFVIVIFREEFLPLRLNIDFNIPHKNTLNLILYNKNIINKDFMELFAPNMKYKYMLCTLNGTPLNVIIINLYMKYFTKKLQFHNKLSHILYSTYTCEIYEYESKVKQGKAFCKIIKEELVSVAFHPKRICPMIMKYGPEILDDL